MDGAGMLRRRPILTVLFTLLVLYLGYFTYSHYQGFQRAGQGGEPLYTDFISTYSTSLLLQNEPAEFAYHLPTLTQYTHRVAILAYGGELTQEQRKQLGFSPWMYPPTFLFFVLPLALLPLLLAKIGWLLLTLSPYLWVTLKAISDRRIGLAIALGSPPFFYNLMYGQNGFLLAALLGGGLLLLRERPITAGILIGLASFKPQFGLLIPFLLVAGGYWKSFATATLTVLAMIGSSLLLWGSEPWYAFIGSNIFYLEGFERGLYNWSAMLSPYSLVYQLTGHLDVAVNIQLGVALMISMFLFWAWWREYERPVSYRLQIAMVLATMPLVVPLFYLYDLPLLVIAMALILHDMSENHQERWQQAILWIAMLSFLLIKPLGGVAGSLLGLSASTIIAGVALLRYWRQT